MEQTRKKPVEFIKEYTGIFAVAGIISFILNGGTSMLPDKMIFSILATLLSSFYAVCEASFYLKAVRRQKPELADWYNIFLDRGNMPKFLSVIIIKFIIDMGLTVVANTLETISALSFAANVIGTIIGFMFIPVMYLLTANPNYSTLKYFKSSAEYMLGDYSNAVQYLKIVFKYIIPLILGYALIVVFVPIIGTYIGAVYVIFGTCRLNLAIANFMDEKLIPEEWYSGAAAF